MTKAEYTRYILLKHGFLPRDVLREIDQKYDSMDVFRTGKVTMEMITMKKTRSLPSGQVVKEKTISFANVQNMRVVQGPLLRYFGIWHLKVDTAGGGCTSAERS